MEVFNAQKKFETKTASCKLHGEFISKLISLPIRHSCKSIIWTQCPDCSQLKNDKESHERRIKQAHEEQRRIENNFAKAAIPKRFAMEGFDTYIADTKEKLFALNVVKEFAENFEHHLKKGTNLILSGTTGTGKEHLALAAAQKIITKGYSVFFTTISEMILRLRASWRDPKAPGEFETLKMLQSVSLLIIDEIGLGYNSDSELDQLYNVIDGRYRDLLPTIFTTNLSTHDFRMVIGDRNFSRIRQDGCWVKMNWEDYREFKNKIRLINYPNAV